VVIHDGSMTTARWHSGSEGARRKKGCSRGGAPLIAGGGKSGAAARLWAARRR
jgi:hypothetical protein